MTLFQDFKLSNELMDSIRKIGIEKPTEIQTQSIPTVMEGKDLIGESATGSGKTLAFGCVIAEKVVQRNGLQALILTPTRELAEQVKEFLRKLNGRLRIISIYGGVSIEPQIKMISKAEVVVATPGRLLDHAERGTIDFSRIRTFVLDEADRMLDMGFIEDVEKIMKLCPSKKQTLFFSATISPEITSLSMNYMKEPVKVSAKKHVDPSKLKQEYYDVAKNMKLSLLIHMLKDQKNGLGIIFCNTRRTTDFVVKNLKTSKLKAIAIHGGLSQNKRNRTLQSFNEGRVIALVCTDVAARGLHIENVSYVYNYEIPKNPKDYVHRIGRTARAGEEGKAINFVSDYDHDNFSRVLQEYGNFKIKKMRKPYVERVLAVTDNSRSHHGRKNFGNDRPSRSHVRRPRRPRWNR